MTPQLVLRKCSYSRHPWRLVYVRADGREHVLPDSGFPRQKDGLPWLCRLLDAADWRVPYETMDEATLARITAICAELPDAVARQAVLARHPLMRGLEGRP